jgi:hypothetical protein
VCERKGDEPGMGSGAALSMLDTACFRKQLPEPLSRHHIHPSYLAKLPPLCSETGDTLSRILPHRDTILIYRWAASMGIAMAIVSRNRHQTFTQKVR